MVMKGGGGEEVGKPWRGTRMKRLVHGVRKPFAFLILCFVVLIANIAVIHRFACANEQQTNYKMHPEEAIKGQSEAPADHTTTSTIHYKHFPPEKPKHNSVPNEDETIYVKSDGNEEDEYMSACLLIKDDNDILNEWLAYHYHALELRYLVVAVDPSSDESPLAILKKWSNLTDLSVVHWSDGDFMPQDFLTNGYHKAPHEINGDAKNSEWHEGHEDPEQVIADNMKILNHRYRQVTFLSRCLGHLKRKQKKWVMHVDTDEFVVVNPLLRYSKQENVQHMHIRDIQEPSSVLKLLRDIRKDFDLRQKIKHPCVSMPRLLFGSVEHSNETIVNFHFNTTLMETSRWLHHTSFEDKERNAQPKVIVDVSAVSTKDEMFRKPFSIHRPSRRLCRGVSELKFSQLQRYPITVNHYTGSWERYNSKNDTRRSRKRYEKKAFVEDGYDRWITPWLDGFIRNQGLNLTRQLLSDYQI